MSILLNRQLNLYDDDKLKGVTVDRVDTTVGAFNSYHYSLQFRSEIEVGGRLFRSRGSFCHNDGFYYFFQELLETMEIHVVQRDVDASKIFELFSIFKENSTGLT